MALNNEVQYDDEELEDVMVKSVDVPNCVKCIYNGGAECKFFKQNKNDVPVDIFNCPKFVDEKDKASDMLGVDFNGS